MSHALLPAFAVVLAALLLACGGDGEANAPDSSTGSSLITSIEGSCRLAEIGSEILLTYRVELSGNAQISRVRLFVDGGLTEETGRVKERTYTRTATIKVPDRSTHIFQVTAEAGSIRSTASTTIPCTLPTQRPPL